MMYSGINVTTPGTMSVDSRTENARSRPMKCNRAKAYAASDDTNKEPRTLKVEILTLLQRNRGMTSQTAT